MRTNYSVWIIIVVAIVVFFVFVLPRLKDALIGKLVLEGAPPREFFYPPAPPMPSVVDSPVEEILAKLEVHMKTVSPQLISFLQPGLMDEDIAAIERKHGVTLPKDLKALYKWHNGCRFPKPGESFCETLGPVPGTHFLSLDDALAERETIREQVKNSTPLQKKAHDTYARHRDSWITLFSDGAGDGYFYDPLRKEDEGAVFYNFCEDGDFVFYPSIKNLLAAALKNFDVGNFKRGNDGNVIQYFERSIPVWLEFGATPRQGPAAQ